MPSIISRQALPRLNRRGARMGVAAAAVAASAGLVAAGAPVASAAMPLLEQGSTGPEVTKVQDALHIVATGDFGLSTKQAVMAFQTQDHLWIDGIVGPQTWGALFDVPHAQALALFGYSESTTATAGYAPASGSLATSTPASGSTQATATGYATPAATPTSSGYTSGYQTTGSTGYSAPAQSAPSTPAPARATGGSGGYVIPGYIVQCESGGNWSAVNPSSGAGGAYQIMPSTWAAYGGQGLPENASPAQQSQIASEIWAHQGPSAWTCAG